MKLQGLPRAVNSDLMPWRLRPILTLLALPWLGNQSVERLIAGDDLPGRKSLWAEIRVIDAATGRGVPLAELETVNGLKFVTDNAGRVAFHEPGLRDRDVFFTVRSHGYEMPKDGFGFTGVRVAVRAGKVHAIKLKRKNVAERLCRLTGEGLYRDSVLLGYKVPQSLNGRVAGQDSVQAALYRGRVYWFWGDTLRMGYPLGLYRTAGATTPLPKLQEPAFDPAVGIPFDYFTDRKTGFARAMMPLPERPEGVIWLSAVFTVPDEHGVEKLIGHYSRRKGLGTEYEHGIAGFNDDRLVFEPLKQLPLSEKWRRPSGQPIVHTEGGTKWLLFGSPTPNVRVPATLQDVLDPAKYEAFTCAAAADAAGPLLAAAGEPVWRWQKQLPPLDSKTEHKWVRQGRIKAEHARYCPADAQAPADRIILHSGSVRWNAHRQRWLLVAGQVGGKPSFLGEVWYAEALHPTGPFPKAVRIVTHDRQSFYNVCQHDFLDRDGGRLIHFEGTYTNDFSGNPEKTPRYNYNQVLYRLDVAAEALRPARTE